MLSAGDLGGEYHCAIFLIELCRTHRWIGTSPNGVCRILIQRNLQKQQKMRSTRLMRVVAKIILYAKIIMR